MTIVCAYKDRGGVVWMGCDSRATGGSFIFPERVDKIIHHGSWVIGHSGDAGALDLIRRKGAAIAAAATPEEVGDILQALYKEADYRKRPDDDGAPDYNQGVILANAREVYQIYSDGSVGRPVWGFTALGSGSPYAYGAAFVARSDHRGDDVVACAVQAAIEFNSGCGGPWRVFKVE